MDPFNSDYINKYMYLYNAFDIRLLTSQSSAAMLPVMYLVLNLDLHIVKL